MRRRVEVAFAALLVAVFGWAGWQATFWPERAALFPLAIAVPAVVLAVVQLGISTLAAAPRGSAVVSDLPERERLRRALQAAGWILGASAAVWAAGFLAAIPLVSFMYLRRAGEGWALSVLIPAGTWAFVYGLFDRLLHVPLPPGELLKLLGVG